MMFDKAKVKQNVITLEQFRKAKRNIERCKSNSGDTSLSNFIRAYLSELDGDDFHDPYGDDPGLEAMQALKLAQQSNSPTLTVIDLWKFGSVLVQIAPDKSVKILRHKNK